MFLNRIKPFYVSSIIVLSIVFSFYFPQGIKASTNGCCTNGDIPDCFDVPPGKVGLTYCREFSSERPYTYNPGDCKAINFCPQYPVQPSTTQPSEEQKKIVMPTLQVEIPGFDGGFKTPVKTAGGGMAYSWINDYVVAIYKWSVSVIAILAVVMIMVAGFQWILSRGNASAISQAKARISGAFMGLIIILSISLFLGFINPNLTILKPMKLYTVIRKEFDNYESVSDIETSCPDASTLKNIPVDNVALYNIIFKSTYSQPLLRQDTLAALIVAAEKLKSKPNQPILQVNNAFRTAAQQLVLYNNRGENPGCEPKPGKCNCPHMTGQGVDVVCKDKSSKDPCQDYIKEVMLAAGFCNLSSEAWHFELPKASKTCF